ncbi:hypothetical protein QYF36_018332 [Acer negundo]|nr:hypothetical protein QYF36_018332 [Acer negundo]
MAVIFTVAVLQEFRDITFSYGVSDEYSFVLKKETLFYQRRASDIVSVIVSFFTSIQVDCHINNQYNTCFWMLFMSGKSKSEAQGYLKGTQTREKNELLIQKFGIDYNQLPIMFRQGSSVFRVEAEKTMAFENGSPAEKLQNKVMITPLNKICPVKVCQPFVSALPLQERNSRIDRVLQRTYQGLSQLIRHGLKFKMLVEFRSVKLE